MSIYKIKVCNKTVTNRVWWNHRWTSVLCEGPTKNLGPTIILHIFNIIRDTTLKNSMERHIRSTGQVKTKTKLNKLGFKHIFVIQIKHIISDHWMCCFSRIWWIEYNIINVLTSNTMVAYSFNIDFISLQCVRTVLRLWCPLWTILC